MHRIPTRVTLRAGSASLRWHESRHEQASVIADVGHKNNRFAMREIGIGGRETFGGIGEGFPFTGVG